MDKFSEASSIYEIQPRHIKAIADAFAAVNPENDGWFTGTIKFKVEGGRVTEICDTKISRSEPRTTAFDGAIEDLRFNGALLLLQSDH